jgi:hypothetical protein
VVQREIAIEPVPLTCEMDRQLLDDVRRSIGADGEERREIADANLALLRARRCGERADK